MRSMASSALLRSNSSKNARTSAVGLVMSTPPDGGHGEFTKPLPSPTGEGICELDSGPVAVLDWMLDSDPSIRWQVLRDLGGAPAEIVAAERARVATEGWGARLLALQGEDGQWEGGALFPARGGAFPHQ